MTSAILLSTYICAMNAYHINWYSVAETDVTSTSSPGVEMIMSSDAVTGNLVITANIFEFGCGSTQDTNVFAFISNGIDGNPYTKWDKIRYTMQFWGISACWSIFGNTHYFRNDELKTTGGGLIEFDIAQDKVLTNTLFYGAWNGETIRCDGQPENFWIVTPDFRGYRGAITVEQRRNKDVTNAGIGSGHSCTTNGKVVFSNIQVGYVENCLCDSDTVLDVMFLLDESGSIEKNEWDIVIDFVSNIIDSDLNEESFISAVEYESEHYEFQQFIPFTKVGGNRDDVISEFKNNVFDIDGATETEDAICRALDLFSQWNGQQDINNERSDILFVLTDDIDYSFCTSKLATCFNTNNVEIVLIGFGSGNWETKLRCLYPDPITDNVYVVHNYDIMELEAVRLQLRDKTCQE